MAKRKSKRQKAAAEAQSARMKAYWAKKKAETTEQGEQAADLVMKMQQVRPILEKVFMAGWRQNKAKTIPFLNNQMSVEDAWQEIERIFSATPVDH